MAEFLSQEWIAELDAAARASAELARALGEGTFTIEQVVRDVPGRGEVRYHVTREGDRARVRDGAASSADLAIATDYEAARALHTGEQNAQQVLASGRLKLRGDADGLRRRGELLGAVGDVFASVRSTTTFAGAS